MLAKSIDGRSVIKKHNETKAFSATLKSQKKKKKGKSESISWSRYNVSGCNKLV